MISTRRHLEYARGFVELGMFAAAAAELDAILPADQSASGVVSVRSDLAMQAKQWELLVLLARECTALSPEDEQGWIHWAYALRELNQIAEAQAVLREAEPRHGRTCAVLHYNLACYACLLGDKSEAMRRLLTAIGLDATFRESALEDPDLKAMRAEIARMK